MTPPLAPRCDGAARASAALVSVLVRWGRFGGRFQFRVGCRFRRWNRFRRRRRFRWPRGFHPEDPLIALTGGEQLSVHVVGPFVVVTAQARGRRASVRAWPAGCRDVGLATPNLAGESARLLKRVGMLTMPEPRLDVRRGRQPRPVAVVDPHGVTARSATGPG